ncbi:DUF5988 family protein [Streptomyces sp. NBC_00243]|uniref:DUF5988 family protein n=1 Tax=unclassified Streptomyces TaxID=2593676 RepID=UPI002DD83A08|nr:MULTISPECIES: DUF5988 family protein [unclassified Streptomyces]WRZ25251.1 DUF5988 family protein [Streptomyces sp. NBC_00243]
MITIVVQGGPRDLGPVHRIEAESPPDRLVLPFYGQHQHFERIDRTERVEGRDVPVFQWTYSTAIAE